MVLWPCYRLDLNLLTIRKIHVLEFYQYKQIQDFKTLLNRSIYLIFCFNLLNCMGTVTRIWTQLYLKSFEPPIINNLTDLVLYLMKLGVGYQHFIINLIQNIYLVGIWPNKQLKWL